MPIGYGFLCFLIIKLPLLFAQDDDLDDSEAEDNKAEVKPPSISPAKRRAIERVTSSSGCCWNTYVDKHGKEVVCPFGVFCRKASTHTGINSSPIKYKGFLTHNHGRGRVMNKVVSLINSCA